jgi:hypothetical protein
MVTDKDEENRLTSEGLKPDPEKIRAMEKMAKPTCTKHTRMSSIIASAPSISETICEIIFWKTSGADFIPNGKRTTLCLPYGMMNVQSLELDSSKRSCQNPLVASSLLNILAFGICEITSSTVLSG